MRSWTMQATIERLVNGYPCEVKGCYDLAVWLVSFDEETSHWCSKHTRLSMRETSRWGDLLGAKMEA